MPNIFLFPPFSIILMFSCFKYRYNISFTTRVSESTRCKVVALVSARPTAVAELKTASVSPALAKRVGQLGSCLGGSQSFGGSRGDNTYTKEWSCARTVIKVNPLDS